MTVNQGVPGSSPGGRAEKSPHLFEWGFFMYYIYILYSCSSDIYYVGYSKNVAQRFIQHNELSEDSFTSKHRPWKLCAVFCTGEKESDAVVLERFIKKQRSRKLIELLIREDFVPQGKLAQLVLPKFRDTGAGL